MEKQGKVAVITGASSGIGRATALAFAKQGYHVALAARNVDELQHVASICQRHGGLALALSTDVSQQGDVERLAQRTLDYLGRIDVWVNNAGVTSVGAFADTPPDTFRRVIEINFFGSVHGTRAALKHFCERGQGTLITVSSVFGAIPSPYESAYVASKFAQRGFDASLRQELQLQGYPDIHVCTVLPAAIDTPIYRNAANTMRRGLQPPPPLYSPDRVAYAIVQLARDPKPEVVIGDMGRAMAMLRALLPSWLFDRLFASYIQRTHFTRSPAMLTAGNTRTASNTTKIRGEWPARLFIKPSHLAAGTALGVGALWLLVRRFSRRGQ